MNHGVVFGTVLAHMDCQILFWLVVLSCFFFLARFSLSRWHLLNQCAIPFNHFNLYKFKMYVNLVGNEHEHEHEDGAPLGSTTAI